MGNQGSRVTKVVHTSPTRSYRSSLGIVRFLSQMSDAQSPGSLGSLSSWTCLENPLRHQFDWRRPDLIGCWNHFNMSGLHSLLLSLRSKFGALRSKDGAKYWSLRAASLDFWYLRRNRSHHLLKMFFTSC